MESAPPPLPPVPARPGERVVYRNRFVGVFLDPVRLPSGVDALFTRVRAGSGFPGVVVLPFRSGCVGLVRQYRPALDRDLWELPRGGAESASSRQEARRELAEETGALAVDLVSLGVLHPDSGLLESQVELFFAELDPDVPFSAVAEVSAVRWVPVPELLASVADGTLTDAFTVAAVSRAHLRGLLLPSQRALPPSRVAARPV